MHWHSHSTLWLCCVSAQTTLPFFILPRVWIASLSGWVHACIGTHPWLDWSISAGLSVVRIKSGPMIVLVSCPFNWWHHQGEGQWWRDESLQLCSWHTKASIHPSVSHDISYFLSFMLFRLLTLTTTGYLFVQNNWNMLTFTEQPWIM